MLAARPVYLPLDVIEHFMRHFAELETEEEDFNSKRRTYRFRRWRGRIMH